MKDLDFKNQYFCDLRKDIVAPVNHFSIIDIWAVIVVAWIFNKTEMQKVNIFPLQGFHLSFYMKSI